MNFRSGGNNGGFQLSAHGFAQGSIGKSTFGSSNEAPGSNSAGSCCSGSVQGLCTGPVHKVFVGGLLPADDHSTAGLVLEQDGAQQINPVSGSAIVRKGTMKK